MSAGGGVEWRLDAPELDRRLWLPHYLPAWSSRVASAASVRHERGMLVLDIPPTHPRWCPGDHTPPLRVSGLQSGSWSGPVGSTRGQQRFREGQVVREEQSRFEGWLPRAGTVSIRAAMTLSQRSMAALWLNGVEDDEDQLRCGELCVFEIFGKDVEAGRSAEVGVGVKAFRDPALTHDFAAPRVELDVGDWHDFAVTWDAEVAVFTVDGRDPPLLEAADLSDAADAGGVRLPGLVDRGR